MRKLFSLLLSATLATAAFAQPSGKISGTVKDETGKGFNAATVSLLSASDSALVKAAVSDKNGQYSFISVKDGSYIISYSSVGYTKSFSNSFSIANGQELNLQAIALAPTVSSMAGVTVQAKRPFIETKIDKTVVNVEATPTSAGSTALELLEKSPGVMVSSEGAISLKGKQGVIILIDNKPTYLSAADLANMLKNMPASALDQIEIMTNPSSKYDAEGNSGVINIKTKKSKTAGFNGNIMVGATTSIFTAEGQTHYIPKSQNSFHFNYRKNKVNFFGNYNPNFFKGRNQQDIRRKFYDESTGDLLSSTEQMIRFKFKGMNHTLKLGMDWYADKKNTFGITASAFSFDGNPRPTTETFIKDGNGNILSGMNSVTENNISFKNFSGNINWRHQFDTTGRELTADVDYLAYDRYSDMMLETIPFDKFGQSGGKINLRGDLPSNIQIVSFKSDYMQPFKWGKLEAGVKSSYVKNDHSVVYTKMMNGQWYDDDRSNHFIYEENINAAYVNLNRQWGKWSLQGGLRIENTNATGNQLKTGETFKRDTTNLFPTAFVSYAVNKTNNLTLSYSKRIRRPDYQMLNPFIFFADSLVFQKGNPYLRPQYAHNIELSHSYKNKYITTFAYNTTDDVIAQIVKPEGIKMFNTYDNVAQLKNISLAVTVPVKVANWWNMNVFANVFNNHYKGFYNAEPIDVNTTSFSANMTNTFTIAKGFSAELSGFYRHRGIDDLAILEPIYQLSLGAQKQIINGKGTVRLNIRDPFAWQQYKGSLKYDGIDMTFHSRNDFRAVTATFTYRFGKQNGQTAPRRRTSSSQEEQSRVGQ